ncbi:MAG: TAXI family TRAP transporter solute-binding subunit [Syntrophales bacterium]
MKKVGYLICALLVSFLVPSVSLAASPVKWAVGTSSSGSGPYKWAVGLASVVNKHQQAVQISAQATAGYNENTVLVADKDIVLGMQTGADIYNAYHQIGKFANQKKFQDLRFCFNFTVEHGHQVVRADSDIKTIPDLKGKKLNMNVPSTATAARNDAILAAYGLSRKDFKIFEISTGESFNALRDKVFDATFNGYNIGNAALVDLSTSIPIRLLGIGETEFKKFNALQNNTMAYGVIPGGTYKGQDTDVKTWMGFGVLFTNKDADERIIYEITKAFWQNLGEVKAIDAGFKQMTPQMALQGRADIPVHPGALRYFKEAGLVK